MAKFSRFGGPRPGTVTIVDTPISHAYARKARIAFFTTTIVVALPASVIASQYLHPLLGLLLGLVIGAVCGFAVAVVVTVWPILRAIWHWTAELVALVAVVFGWPALIHATNTVVALLLVVALVGVPAGWPALRRRVVAVGWCVVVRHRLRACFAGFIRTANRTHPGTTPLILWARPTPAGERVWVWLRPGMDLSDLEGKTGKLAVACWADQVQVVRAASSYAALIRVDIARRDPLTATFSSPLLRLVPDLPVDAPVSPGMPPVGLDLPDVPDPVDTTTVRPIRRTRPTAGPVDRGDTGVNDAFI